MPLYALTIDYCIVLTYQERKAWITFLSVYTSMTGMSVWKGEEPVWVARTMLTKRMQSIVWAT